MLCLRLPSGLYQSGQHLRSRGEEMDDQSTSQNKDGAQFWSLLQLTFGEEILTYTRIGAREVLDTWRGWLTVSASRTTNCRLRASSKIRSTSPWIWAAKVESKSISGKCPTFYILFLRLQFKKQHCIGNLFRCIYFSITHYALGAPAYFSYFFLVHHKRSKNENVFSFEVTMWLHTKNIISTFLLIHF